MYDSEEEQWSDPLQKRYDTLLVSSNIRESRVSICKNCDQLARLFCKQCKCFMPVKTWVANANCPLNKWKE